MDVRSPIAHVKLGGYLAYLAARGANDRVDGESNVLASLGQLDFELGRLGFRVSSQIFRSRLFPLLQRLHANVQQHPNEPTYLNASDAKILSQETEGLTKAVHAECETCLIAVPTNRRFNFEILIRDPNSLFASGVIDGLPELAKFDVVSACRCIAFACPTAAAFHILRGLEACVRLLYAAYFPRRNSRRAWGPLCQELKQKPRNPKPEPLLLSRLDELRGHFRNPTQHPEKVYTLDEAQDLLHLAIEFLPRCINDPRVVRRLTQR